MATTEEPTTLHRGLQTRAASASSTSCAASRTVSTNSALARRLGLHANTVRWHLGILADAGLVSARRADQVAVGRPRTIYALSLDAMSDGKDEFRLLASVLTGALAEDRDAVAKSETAGWSWGR